MLYLELKKSRWFLLLFVLAVGEINAQYVSSGSKGDLIFFEDFGNSPSVIPEFLPLTLVSPTATTEYLFNAGVIDDGNYHVTNLSNSWTPNPPKIINWDWHVKPDHTSGDGLGRMLLVNADFAPDEFFRLDVNNLCANTTYEFSAWYANLSPTDSPHIGKPKHGDFHRPIDITFEIFDQFNKSIAVGVTGPVSGTSYKEGLNWKQGVLVFTTPSNVTSITLVMSNNGKGGFGNDIAIDDIAFRARSAERTMVTDNLGKAISNICGADIAKLVPTIKAKSTNPSMFYQWQGSSDGKTWIDIHGENKSSLTPVLPNPLNTPVTLYFRVKFASTPDNLFNSNCVTVSNIYQLRICY